MNARVLLVTSEAVPLVKTGGLADVITSLAGALRRRGIDATVLMPGYPAAKERAEELESIGELPDLPGGSGRLLKGVMPGSDVPVVLLETACIDARTANPYVDCQGQEFADNAQCFASLSHAAVSICAGETALPIPHVVHANDWHAGLIAALLKLRQIDNVGSLLTIHNLAFQGNYPMDLASALGIPDWMLTPDEMEFWGRMSFLKAGIRHADRISTVSQSYANEILTPRFGHGMDGLLNVRRQDLVAIRNGVDTDTWDPANDTLIARQFSLADMRGKTSCKRELQMLFNLPVEPFAPVLAIGSRITHQKMADVALRSLPEILTRYPRAQLVLVGRGDREYEQGFMALAERFAGRVGVYIGYEEKHAHALHAGADMLLHGTRFEPFGLTPLYSMRYGTIPIASRVGGMIDSIADGGLSGPVPDNANGILFDGETADDMSTAVSRAFELYAIPNEWHAMQRNAMSANFSWDPPAEQYMALYREIAPAHARALFSDAQDAQPADAQHYKTA
ncbi:glycogen synthase GlgA [Noviherbaspirillum saxi]|uniref:Glycogen synthase n=1 Tax=Noviherbaspirillum saxi TaxID=2320863 RepID=A0A3A3FJA2_9BURK|nr:glycogen synthase GlgA [Noviherbaspirillum saxi]RJF95324.1 glycogen synthase GlgA [Noviherbaspirillum saxi]